MNLSSFVEANKEVISFINDCRCDDNINQQLEKNTGELHFQNHPEISQYLEGATLLEYSAHNIPKGHKTKYYINNK